MNKISGVYKITNTVTNDFYVGSSKDVKCRWANHKCPSRWKECPNNKMYLDMQKYGFDNFDFQILAMRDPDQLKETEQEFIEKLQPTYNDRRADEIDVEKQKTRARKYRISYKGKAASRKYNKKYFSKICNYNGEELTLSALSIRFYRAGIEHPVLEAKKYLEKNNDENEEEE